MRQAIIEVVFDRNKRAETYGSGSVEVRFFYGGKQTYFSTGVLIEPKYWKNGRVTRHREAAAMNETIEILLMRVRRAFNDLIERGEFSLADLREAVRVKERKSDEFLAFCSRRIEVRCYTLTDARRRRYMNCFELLKEWGGIRKFGDVSERKILEFDRLLVARGLKQSTRWAGYHRTLNSFLIDAHHEGLIRANPYRNLRFGRDDGEGAIERRLTFAELDRLRTAELPTPSMERVRDLFLFQTYTCLSYTDLAEFDATRIEQTGSGLIYRGKRVKTGADFVFLVMRPAMTILSKYGGELPIISNEKYNLYLKALAKFAGIEKPLSSHYARHTGATLLLNSGVDMEVVAKILGHKSTAMTRRIYAKLLDTTVAESMSRAEKVITKA